MCPSGRPPNGVSIALSRTLVTSERGQPLPNRFEPHTRGDQPLGKPTARTMLARVPLCLRPKELCMLLSDDVATLDVVKKHSTLLHVS